jgi:hypothetical protein
LKRWPCTPDAAVIQRRARYTPDATTWVKIKNQHYSQATGRQDFSNRKSRQ